MVSLGRSPEAELTESRELALMLQSLLLKLLACVLPNTFPWLFLECAPAGDMYHTSHTGSPWRSLLRMPTGVVSSPSPTQLSACVSLSMPSEVKGQFRSSWWCCWLPGAGCFVSSVDLNSASHRVNIRVMSSQALGWGPFCALILPGLECPWLHFPWSFSGSHPMEGLLPGAGLKRHLPPSCAGQGSLSFFLLLCSASSIPHLVPSLSESGAQLKMFLRHTQDRFRWQMNWVLSNTKSHNNYNLISPSQCPTSLFFFFKINLFIHLFCLEIREKQT